MEIKDKVEELKELYFYHSPIYFHLFERSLQRGESEIFAFRKLCNQLHLDNIKYDVNRENITELSQGERQSHGFTYQEVFCRQNELIEVAEYTAPYDAYSKNKETYWSIKTMGKGSGIDFGDVFIRSKANNDFFLQVGVWENEKTNFVEEHTLLIPVDDWKSWFNYDLLPELHRWINDEVLNDRSYNDTWKQKRLEFSERWGDLPIRLNFKRDSKTQKRIQCSINNSYFYDVMIPQYKIETKSIYQNDNRQNF